MITVNDKKYDLEEGLTVSELLEKLRKSDRFQQRIKNATIVVINKEVIPAGKYDTRVINKDDNIYVLTGMAGG